jgi:carbon storage regulator CsrA
MLVLQRYEKEGVRVGDDLLVTVLEVDKENGSVRLGFLAPDSTRILREEIWNKNQVESVDATDKT